MLNGERLKLLRKYRGLTLNDVGERLRTLSDSAANTGMISRWENGKTVPRIETIELLADILEVDKEFLIGLNTLGYELKELRLKHKLTEKELASKTGLSEEAILLFEDDLDEPSDEELNKLGEAFSLNNFHEYLVTQGVKMHNPTTSRNKMILDNVIDTHIDVTFQNRLLSPADRERVLKMLEVLFPGE